MRRQPSQESVFGESRPQDESERDPTEGNILKDRCGKRKAVAAHHAASMRALVQLLEQQKGDPRAGGHLQSISALSDAIASAADPNDPRTVALRALATSVRSVCSSIASPLSGEGQSSHVLDTLRQLTRSMEELLA
jgi:hypothetical protein